MPRTGTGWGEQLLVALTLFALGVFIVSICWDIEKHRGH